MTSGALTRIGDCLSEKERVVIGELGVPVIRGRITQTGGTVASISFEELAQYKELMVPGSIALLDVREADGEICSVSARIRLGHTDTWLAAHVNLLLNDREEEPSNHLGETSRQDGLLDAPLFTKEQEDGITQLAAMIAANEDFSEVALRVGPRERFVTQVVKSHMKDFGGLGPFTTEDHVVYAVSHRARDYWDAYVIPLRAQHLSDRGLTAAGIAKEIGITKQRAERALASAARLTDGIGSAHMLPIISRHLGL